MSQEKIYTYCLDFWGEDVHIFIEKESEVERLRGSEIYNMLKVICDDPEKIKVVKQVFGKVICGHNPLDEFHMICNEDCPSDCDGNI